MEIGTPGWPDGVGPGAKMEQKHDLYWLETISTLYCVQEDSEMGHAEDMG